MKKSIKRLAICLAVVAVATVGTLLGTTKSFAIGDSECPNGCKLGTTGCYCRDYYEYYREANTEVISRPTEK